MVSGAPRIASLAPNSNFVSEKRAVVRGRLHLRDAQTARIQNQRRSAAVDAPVHEERSVSFENLLIEQDVAIEVEMPHPHLLGIGK